MRRLLPLLVLFLLLPASVVPAWAADTAPTRVAAPADPLPNPPEPTCKDCLKVSVNSTQLTDHLDVLAMPMPFVFPGTQPASQSLLRTLSAPDGYRFYTVDLTLTMTAMPGMVGLPELADADAYSYGALPMGDGFSFGYTLPRGLRPSPTGHQFFGGMRQATVSATRRGIVAYLVPNGAKPATLSFSITTEMGEIPVVVPL